MKTFEVNVYCSCFAKVVVEAEDSEHAKKQAMHNAPRSQFEVETHTIEPQIVEQITEVEAA